MYADINAAISVERRLGRSKATTKDLLARVCAQYNRMTTIKKHRVDGARKSLLYNLLLGENPGFHFWLHIFVASALQCWKQSKSKKHNQNISYSHDTPFEAQELTGVCEKDPSALWCISPSTIRHVIEENAIDDTYQAHLVCFVLIVWCLNTTLFLESFPAGLPLEILSQDFWVPGSTVRAEGPQFLGKELYSEILQCTNETAYLYALRACEDVVCIVRNWGPCLHDNFIQ